MAVGSKKQQKIDTSEMGTTGLPIWSGQISPDDNEIFNHVRQAVKIYKQMRNDSTLSACYLCKELPIRSTRWYIQPASDTPDDKATAEFVQDALFRRMSVTWDKVLAEVCLKFIYGFWIHEKVWKEEDGKIYLKKLASRLPETLDKWDFDDNGGPKTFTQLTTDEKGKTKKVTIPIDKLVVWVNRQEGSNLLGRSDYRACYRDWWTKDRLQRLQLIDYEHDAVGVPVIHLPRGSSLTDLNTAKDIVTKIRKDQSGGVVLFEDWKNDSWPSGGQNRQSATEMIHRYDRQMMTAFLAQFLDLGSTDTGSFALSEDQTTTFLLGVEAEAREIEAGFDRYVIPQLVDYNDFKVKDMKYPRLKHREVTKFNAQNFATTLNALATGQWVLPRGELDEKFIRQKLELPEPEKYTPVTPPMMPGQPGVPTPIATNKPGVPVKPTAKVPTDVAKIPKPGTVPAQQTTPIKDVKTPTPAKLGEDEWLEVGDLPITDEDLLPVEEVLRQLNERRRSQNERLLLSIPEEWLTDDA